MERCAVSRPPHRTQVAVQREYVHWMLAIAQRRLAGRASLAFSDAVALAIRDDGVDVFVSSSVPPPAGTGVGPGRVAARVASWRLAGHHGMVPGLRDDPATGPRAGGYRPCTRSDMERHRTPHIARGGGFIDVEVRRHGSVRIQITNVC